jgi:hypothetical protein
MSKNILEKSRKLNLKSFGAAMFLTFVFSFSTLMAQETIPASGGNATGGEGTVSYSVGQVIYEIHSGTSGSITPGVQQPYEISMVTGIEEALALDLSVSAYPNPAMDHLTLKVDEAELSNLSFQLYDMNGNLLQQQIITGNETRISMLHLVPATYFVKIIQNEKELITLKVIKTQ